jgi:hypothetical protein
VIPAGLPLTTEIACYIDLPKIKKDKHNKVLSASASKVKRSFFSEPAYDSRRNIDGERKNSNREMQTTPKAAF